MMAIVNVGKRQKQKREPEKLVSINSGELKVLYDIFTALKLADEKPCPINAKRIVSSYVAARKYYDKHEPRRK